MTRFKAGVTGSPRDAPEGKWVLRGGIEIQNVRINKCKNNQKRMEESNKKAICAKKLKGLNIFLIH